MFPVIFNENNVSRCVVLSVWCCVVWLATNLTSNFLPYYSLPLPVNNLGSLRCITYHHTLCNAKWSITVAQSATRLITAHQTLWRTIRSNGSGPTCFVYDARLIYVEVVLCWSCQLICEGSLWSKQTMHNVQSSFSHSSECTIGCRIPVRSGRMEVVIQKWTHCFVGNNNSGNGSSVPPPPLSLYYRYYRVATS